MLSMTVVMAPMMPTSHQNCAPSPPGKCGNGTLMPHRPVSTVIGSTIVETTVSTFMMRLRRFEIADRYPSRMPVTRSWSMIASSV